MVYSCLPATNPSCHCDFRVSCASSLSSAMLGTTGATLARLKLIYPGDTVQHMSQVSQVSQVSQRFWLFTLQIVSPVASPFGQDLGDDCSAFVIGRPFHGEFGRLDEHSDTISVPAGPFLTSLRHGWTGRANQLRLSGWRRQAHITTWKAAGQGRQHISLPPLANCLQRRHPSLSGGSGGAISGCHGSDFLARSTGAECLANGKASCAPPFMRSMSAIGAMGAMRAMRAMEAHPSAQPVPPLDDGAPSGDSRLSPWFGRAKYSTSLSQSPQPP